MEEVEIAKYSLRNIVPSGRPIKKLDVDNFINNNKEPEAKERKKKNKEKENENCKVE